MARTAAYNGGSGHRTAVSSIVELINSDLQHQMREFHNHSKDCRTCRNPVLAYKNNLDLCHIGRNLCVTITKLLYKKAEHVGAFTIEYKMGWEAVDGLIRIITHYNQGDFSNEIVDIKKRHTTVSQVPTIEGVPHGSQWEEDIRRREQARLRNSSSPRTSNSNFNQYGGNPRTSYLDTINARDQADVSPASSSRSVHFDSHVHVREFTNP